MIPPIIAQRQPLFTADYRLDGSIRHGYLYARQIGRYHDQASGGPHYPAAHDRLTFWNISWKRK